MPDLINRYKIIRRMLDHFDKDASHPIGVLLNDGRKSHIFKNGKYKFYYFTSQKEVVEYNSKKDRYEYKDNNKLGAVPESSKIKHFIKKKYKFVKRCIA